LTSVTSVICSATVTLEDLQGQLGNVDETWWKLWHESISDSYITTINCRNQVTYIPFTAKINLLMHTSTVAGKHSYQLGKRREVDNYQMIVKKK
jgi:hypothetical protein